MCTSLKCVPVSQKLKNTIIFTATPSVNKNPLAFEFIVAIIAQADKPRQQSLRQAVGGIFPARWWSQGWSSSCMTAARWLTGICSIVPATAWESTAGIPKNGQSRETLPL
jgi:hypothetical protein